MDWPSRLIALRARPRRSVARPGAVAGPERHDECRALIEAGAAHFDVASVQQHQVVHDRQTESQTTVSARRGAVSLPEPIEHMWQKCGLDADAGIHHLDLNAPYRLVRR